jgi:hypothetical protein
MLGCGAQGPLLFREKSQLDATAGEAGWAVGAAINNKSNKRKT